MTDRASNTASMRMPLQENLDQTTNIHRRQSLSNITNQNGVNKLASDANVIKPTFVAPFARRGPSMNAIVADDRDVSRPRIALQQKPLNSNTANIRALQPPSNNNAYKPKQTAPVPSPMPLASKHHSTLSYPTRDTKFTQAQHYPHAHYGLKNTGPSYPARSDTVVQSQHSYSQHNVKHSVPSSHLVKTDTPPQAQAPETPVKDDTAAAQDPLQFQASAPEYGSKEWIDGLVQILPRCKFYYDCVDQTMSARLTKVLNHYHAHVTKFFSLDVTHIVTTNYIPRSKTPSQQQTPLQRQPPTTPMQSPLMPGKLPMKTLALPPNPNAESNILVKALSHGIKIWSLERMVNLLNPLVGGRIAKTGQQLENRNLQDFLQHEKVYGLTTTQNDDSPRAEYHVLKDHYVLVEDVTGHYRTILATEFPNEAPKYGGAPWPRLYVQPHSNRSPFVFAHDRSKRTKKPEETVNKDKDETTKGAEEGQKDQEIPAETNATPCDPRMMPSVPASGIINSVTSNVISTTSAMGKPVAVQGLQSTLDQLGKRVLNATKGEAGVVPPVVKTSEFVHPGSIVRANRTTTTDMESNSLKRQPLVGVDLNTVAPEQSKVPPPKPVQDRPSATALDAQPLKEKPVEESATRATVPKDYRNKGYCENCRQLYDDFNAHTATPEHRRYAHDSSKFAHLDKLLMALQRKPKVVTVHADAQATEQGQASGKDGSPAMVDNNPALVAVSEQHAKPNLDTVQNASTPIAQRFELQSRSERYSKSALPAIAQGTPKQTIEAVRTEVRKTVVEPIPEATHIQRVAQGDTKAAKEPVEDLCNEDQAEDAEDFDDQLSSEMSRLDVTEADHQDAADAADAENDDRLIQMPSAPSTADDAPRVDRMTDASEPNRHQRLRVKPAFHDRLRLAYSDMGAISESQCVSQTDTDATQPDERFLECSGIIPNHTSQITDPVPQIELAISLTDGPEASEDLAADNFKLDETNESDKEGTDDAVALLKSPSAGRGAFAKAQGAMLRQAMGLPLGQATPGGQDPVVPLDRGVTSGLFKGALKRKLENVLAEERGYDWSSQVPSTGHPQAPGTPRPQQATTKPIVYDDSLRSRLLQQSTTPQRPVSWPNQRPFSTLPLPPAPPSFSSPKQVSHQRRHVGTDDTSDTIPMPSFAGSEAEGSALERYDSEVRSVGSSGGYPTTPLAPHRTAYNHQQQQQQQQYHHQHHQRSYSNHHSIPQVLRSNPPYHSSPPVPRYPPQGHAAQQSRRGVEITVNDRMSTHSPRSAVPTSPTSPLSYHHYEMQHQHSHPQGTATRATTPTAHHPRSQSPTDSTYSGSGSGYSSSPSRSPSQRSKIYRMQKIPTMSHAEQERERCYHHYRGNRLPESAGQKKVKSSSGLEDEFEEYGEGCMVYIE
ncbi:hypothetical protein BGZ67_004389 [Mortierella alpina]|nr:hypothetical protein BGZ67_004389 [Mortierella alpina]